MMSPERTRASRPHQTYLPVGGGARPRRATLEMVQRGAIVKDGNGYTDYALDVVQGDGSVNSGRRRGVDHC